jgi:hypothetical protein
MAGNSVNGWLFVVIQVAFTYCDPLRSHLSLINSVTQLVLHLLAIVAQWRLCALIAEVVRVKGEVVDGVPPDGFAFVGDEPPICAEVHGVANWFFILDSGLFAQKEISVRLEDEFCLARRADSTGSSGGSVTRYSTSSTSAESSSSSPTVMYHSCTSPGCPSAKWQGSTGVGRSL